jgi:catechol 2,3-dioxygenase-like lactoylglutathione lyase family enzyme
MADRATANLPSRDFAVTAGFYGALGFKTGFRDDGWMILVRGSVELEFFPMPQLKPKESWFSACLRVDDIDELYVAFLAAADASGVSRSTTAIPRLTPPVLEPFGLRMFALVDPDGSLIRCISNS